MAGKDVSRPVINITITVIEPNGCPAQPSYATFITAAADACAASDSHYPVTTSALNESLPFATRNAKHFRNIKGLSREIVEY